MQKQKSIKKVKAEGTQEFFAKTKNAFTFNKAPVNKGDAKIKAKQQYIEKTEREETGLHDKAAKAGRKRSAFVAKLYRDEEDLDELKVLGGDDFDSDLNEEMPTERKREKKQKEKTDVKTEEADGIKIGKLRFEKGSVAMFAVSEVYENKYAIVNHTRNVKGFIDLKENAYQLTVGQLLVAQVKAIGTGTHNADTSRNLNRKLQLTLDPKQLYKGLGAEKVTSGMVLQAVIESKEQKGYILDIGFKDGAKGFLKLDGTDLKTGSLATVIVKSTTSKLIKCELLSELQKTQTVQTEENVVTIHTIKPGYLVNAKVSRLYENGIELSFLGGMNGTVFVDHLEKGSISHYKVGEKVKARVISTDVASKTVTLSMLTHIVSLKPIVPAYKVGESFKEVKVDKLIFGNSFLIRLSKDQLGFLHKSNSREADEVLDEDSKILEDIKIKKKAKKIVSDGLSVGQTILQVRIKEQNYFDGKPILSMKEEVLTASVLNYDSVNVGDNTYATIESVNAVTKSVHLKISEFVKGVLTLEHMADHPLKVIPPKLTQIGKQIKVRVFAIENRTILFTKKDTLMKEKVPIYSNPASLGKGDKVYGVVVGQSEYGFVLRSFGGVKGLLTFDDIKKSSSQKIKIADVKEGTVLKTFVLFNKKNQGVALTLDRKKAKKDKEETSDSYLVKYGPSEEEAGLLKQTHSALAKQSAKDELIGHTFSFRCVETKSFYYVVKTSDKKAKFGIVPKCLVSSFGINLSLNDAQFVFEGVVIEHVHGIPVIAAKPELSQIATKVANKDEMEAGSTHVGFVSNVSEKLGVTVQFFNRISIQVPVKDLQETQQITNFYKIGQVVSVTRNTKGRFSLKSKVLHKSDPKAHQNQLEAQITAFDKLFKASTQSLDLKIGMKVKATVQLVKDYGLIAALEGHQNFTGFIVNEQKSSGKVYKVGSVVECIVLDIDTAKMIVDLSERLLESKTSKELSIGSQKAIVELNKEQYLIVSFKKSRQQIGVCIPNDFTQVNKTELYAKYQVGSEIKVRVVSSEERGFALALPAQEEKAVRAPKNLSLDEGSLVSGPVRSIKGSCIFVQVGSAGKVPVIGRLHRVETFSQNEFDTFKSGDIITAKVLRKSDENGRTWIELTRRKQHMSATKLDKELCSLLQLETMKEGQTVEGIVIDTLDQSRQGAPSSTPVSVMVSAFVRSNLNFNEVLTVQDLISGTSAAQVLSKKYKIGQRVSLVYKQGKLVPQEMKTQSYEVGTLTVVRYIKSVQGFGVTVQLDEKTFGMIELCELNDEVASNVARDFADKGVFLARIIGTDKKGRFQLSSRQSVIDQEMWNLTRPDGSSAHFKTADAKRQSNGNLRNAILKYGAKLVLAKNTLVLGYVTNVSKAGCFIQIGHNTSIRAGLNELSDRQNFDFQKEMPIGRLVLARITKTEQDNTRFHCSTRQSLVVYGVDQVDFSALKPDQEHSAIVLAVADGVAFGQLKGSYYKLKIKDTPASVTAGTVCQVQLLKVVKDKLSAKFIQVEPKEATSAAQRQVEHRAQQIYASVQEEAAKDIAMAAKLASEQPKSVDLEQMIINQRNNTQLEEQIRDLEAIQEIEEDADMESDEGDENDSDAEEMQKIIQASKVHDESDSDESVEDDDDDEEAEDDLEEGEEDLSDDVKSSEDEEMVSEEESKIAHNKSGKSALRYQISQEKEIRQKEAEMRSKDGVQPKTINDFERLLIADQDQSYLWIQYMAFMLEILDVEAARRVAERAVKSISITAETDKLNLWIAYMNLENKFGSQQQLQAVVKRAIEVNDRLKVYLQLINIYRASDKTDFVEDIYKMLCKKHFENLSIWSSYIEFLFEMRSNMSADQFTPPKTILQRALQALPKSKHINIITKFGSLEYKFDQPESGRTMFEGIVTNYPKRMDVWSIYMDMEIKYGGANNQTQARHLFERCLAVDEIKRKPKKMKLVFRKYMEFESAQGNQSKLADLRKRVEQYLEQAFKQEASDSESGSQESKDE